MRIEEVRLRNFRSYGDSATAIAFRPGLNVLLGRIGSGKSSILESMLISLFGFSGSGPRKNDVLRRDATPEKFQIELTFLYEGSHFKLARGTETRLETSPDGLTWTVVSENASDINEYIEETLGISARKFRDLFYSAQGELTNVITGSAEVRQKSIDKLLGAEMLRDTFDLLTEFVKFYDEDIGKAKGALVDTNAYLSRYNLDQMRDDRRKGEQDLIGIGEQVEALNREISSVDQQLKRLVAQAEPIQDAHEKVQRIAKSIANKEADLKNGKFQIGELERRISESVQLLEKGRARLAALGPQRAKAEAAHRELDSLHERLYELKSKAAGLVEQHSALMKRVDFLRRDVGTETRAVDGTQAELEKIEQALSRCASGKRNAEGDISATQKAIEEIKAQMSAQDEELRKLELKASTVHEKVVEDAGKISRLGSLSEGAECPFCEQPVSKSHRARVIARVEVNTKRLLREEEQARSSADRCRRALDEMKAKSESHGRGLERLQADIRNLDTELARQGQNKSNLTRNLTESRSRRKRYEDDLAAESAALENLNAQLGAIRSASGLQGEDWLAALQRRLEETQRQRQQAQRDLAQIDGEIRSTEESSARLEKDTRRDSDALEGTRKSIGSLESELAGARKEISAAYEPLVGKTDDPQGELLEMLSGITRQIDAVKDDMSGKRVSKERLSGEYRQKTDWVAQIDQRIKEYIQEQRKAAQLNRTMTIYSEGRNLLEQIREKYKDAREMIRTNLINVLRETLRVEFDRLYAYEDFHDVEVSDDYEVSLVGPMGRIEAHNLSAGQKAIVSIAFRLAVAKAMKMNIGCWIIDEPTQNIGKAEVEALANVLADTSEIPQIIVATHHEALGRHGNVVSLDIRNGETVLGPEISQLGRAAGEETAAK